MRRSLAAAGIAAALAAGFGASTLLLDGVPGTETTTVTVAALPTTKAGAELTALAQAARLLVLTRSKFVDAGTGILANGTYAQCFPAPNAGWWACAISSWERPRPRAWISVSHAGEAKLKGEQPNGYGWEVPAPATNLVARARRPSGWTPAGGTSP